MHYLPTQNNESPAFSFLPGCPTGKIWVREVSISIGFAAAEFGMLVQTYNNENDNDNESNDQHTHMHTYTHLHTLTHPHIQPTHIHTHTHTHTHARSKWVFWEVAQRRACWGKLHGFHILGLQEFPTGNKISIQLRFLCFSIHTKTPFLPSQLLSLRSGITRELLTLESGSLSTRKQRNAQNTRTRRSYSGCQSCKRRGSRCQQKQSSETGKTKYVHRRRRHVFNVCYCLIRYAVSIVKRVKSKIEGLEGETYAKPKVPQTLPFVFDLNDMKPVFL